MTIDLTFHYIPKFRKSAGCAAKEIMCPSVPKYARLQKDAFISKKLSVLNSAGSFSINTHFADALKSLSKKDIYKLKFHLNHETKTISIDAHPKLTTEINNFINEIPEFYYVFRPKTDEPDLAHHVLSTFQQVIKHPEYSSLSNRKQNILLHAALLHDVGKALESEPEHAEVSVRMLKLRMEKLDMHDDDKKLITKLIEHHHYCYNIKYNVKTYADYTKIFSEKEFKLLRLLTESDLSSKEVSIKNLRRMVENKTIFKHQENLFKTINAERGEQRAYKREFVA